MSYSLTKLTLLLSAAMALGLSGCSDPDKDIIKQAQAAQESGDISTAANLYTQVSEDSPKHRREAKRALRDLVSVKTLESVSTQDFSSVLKSFNAFGMTESELQNQGVYDLAIARIKANDGSEDVAAHDLLHAAETLNALELADVSAMDISLITAINAADPTHVNAASELSEGYFADSNLEAAKTVLLPVQGQLDMQEGARILGQIFLSEGNNNDAYPLLSRYTSARLDTLQSAEAAFIDSQTKLWDAEFGKLQAGQAPDSFYEAYDAKPESEQQVFVDEYIGDKINNNESFQRKLNAYREAAAIVPVAMDFGILQLRAAEAMQTDSERQEELKAAENTFLSIKNVAGDSDDYKLYLGQIYFWLGKQDEGQALFDELLANNSRAPQTLLAVASTLRTLGKVGPSKTLTQEAYDSSKDNETKYGAANIMHHLSTTLEDKVKWLERSDTQSIFVQASLAEHKGHLATISNDDVAAAKHYRKAINLFESLPENATNYNNSALAHFSLHRVSGDLKAYQAGVKLMSLAVELEPDQSILLSNAASVLVTNSLYDTLDNSIDYAYIKTQPTLETVQFHYANADEKAVLRTKLSQHKDMQKAIDYYERAVLLSPNSVSNYTELRQIHYFFGDDEALIKLAAKMQTSQVDVSAITESYVTYVKGEDSEKELSRITEQENGILALLANKNISSATRAALHTQLAEMYRAQTFYAVSSAASSALSHSEIAAKTLSSSSTETQLISALFGMADANAADKFPSYKTLRDQTLKGLAPTSRVALAIANDDEVGVWLRENAHVKRAIEKEAERQSLFPDALHSTDWAVLRRSHQEAAKRLEKRITQSEGYDAMGAMRKISAPLSLSALTEAYFYGQIVGTPGVDQAKLDTLEALGIGLPRGLFP